MHKLQQERTIKNEFGVPITTALVKDPDTGKYYLDGKKSFGSANIAFDPADEAILISGIESLDPLLKGRFIETVTALAAKNCPRGIVKAYIAPKNEEEAKGLIITTDTSGDFLRRGASRLMKLEASEMNAIALKDTHHAVDVIDLKAKADPHAHDAALLGLLKQTYWDDDAELTTVKVKVEAASHLFVINDDHGTPIAMIRAVDNGNFLYVSDSVVDKAHRNKGHMTQLMNKLHDVAKAAGKAVVLVRGSDNGNKPELGNVTEAGLETFYKRLGYQENEAVLFRYYNSKRVVQNALTHQGAFFSTMERGSTIHTPALTVP